jgi:transposase-like protein
MPAQPQRGQLEALKPATPKKPHKAFKAYEPGCLHMYVKYLPKMADEAKRSYLFVAIDRATRCVFVKNKKNKAAACAKSFHNALHKVCPLKIQKLLTDNGKEFTDRLFESRARQPTGEREFDQP